MAQLLIGRGQAGDGMADLLIEEGTVWMGNLIILVEKYSMINDNGDISMKIQ